ncbi:unnamed protein product [Alopecurus aequalis]
MKIPYHALTRFLPDDAVSEILSWVPVKPVCRFRCVSKGWHALISGPAFVAVHKTRSEPLLLSATNSNANYSREISSSVLQLIDMNGNTISVIKMADLWTFNKGVDGPLYFTHGIRVFDRNFVLSVMDLATGNVIKTSEELNDSLLHFLYKFLKSYRDIEEYVYRFDLEREEWKAAIKGPSESGINEVEKNILATNMVKFNDALCMVHRSSINIWLIWLLADSTEGTWVKLYTLPMALTFDVLMPLMVMRDGRKLLFSVCNNSTELSTLQVHDPLTGICTHIVTFADTLFGNAGIRNLHLECFVSPKISPVAAPSL